MSQSPISKSQKRAMTLLGLPLVETYKDAAAALENALCHADGIPAGHTWRSAAKLSDADLVSQVKFGVDDFSVSAVNLAEYGY